MNSLNLLDSNTHRDNQFRVLIVKNVSVATEFERTVRINARIEKTVSVATQIEREVSI
jgi:hypothetical protein